MVQRDGRTMTAEAVEYPAVAVPADGDLIGWGGFMGSVDQGTDALADQYEAFVERCPTTPVVLAGYSQGAMVVHRNLEDLADDPNLAGLPDVEVGHVLTVTAAVNDPHLVGLALRVVDVQHGSERFTRDVVLEHNQQTQTT